MINDGLAKVPEPVIARSGATKQSHQTKNKFNGLKMVRLLRSARNDNLIFFDLSRDCHRCQLQSEKCKIQNFGQPNPEHEKPIL
jgi:hypothetical protein